MIGPTTSKGGSKWLALGPLPPKSDHIGRNCDTCTVQFVVGDDASARLEWDGESIALREIVHSRHGGDK